VLKLKREKEGSPEEPIHSNAGFQSHPLRSLPYSTSFWIVSCGKIGFCVNYIGMLSVRMRELGSKASLMLICFTLGGM